jgi:hypothetical protein
LDHLRPGGASILGDSNVSRPIRVASTGIDLLGRRDRGKERLRNSWTASFSGLEDVLTKTHSYHEIIGMLTALIVSLVGRLGCCKPIPQVRIAPDTDFVLFAVRQTKSSTSSDAGRDRSTSSCRVG